MCTMAWDVSGENLWICFNRDEQRSRPPAEPPQISLGKSGFARIFARDPLGGGTWLGASEAGFIVALMNNYEAGLGGDDVSTSRGSIVLDLIDRASAMEAEKAIVGMKTLKDFAPFHLFILSLTGARQWSWNRRILRQSQDCPRFWTTSSHMPEAICTWRMNQWSSLTRNVSVSLARASAILRMQGPDPAYGMTMDREDARTVSHSCITLGKGILRMRYAPREVDGFSFEDPVTCAL